MLKKLAKIDKMWNVGNPEVRTSEKADMRKAAKLQT